MLSVRLSPAPRIGAMCQGISTSTVQLFVIRSYRMAPVAIPVVVEIVLVGDDGVGDAIGGADREVVTGAVIAIEVDHDVDAVDLLFEVALHALQRARHRGRLDVAEGHRQPIRRRQDPGLGGQRRRLAIERLDLAEVGDVLGVLPLLRVDAAVDLHRMQRQYHQRQQQ